MRAGRPALPMTGGCCCRAIRYEIISFPLLLYTCNCTNCQPAAGAQCHETSPSDFRPLAEKWRAMRPEFFPPE